MRVCVYVYVYDVNARECYRSLEDAKIFRSSFIAACLKISVLEKALITAVCGVRKARVICERESGVNKALLPTGDYFQQDEEMGVEEPVPVHEF